MSREPGADLLRGGNRGRGISATNTVHGPSHGMEKSMPPHDAPASPDPSSIYSSEFLCARGSVLSGQGQPPKGGLGAD